MDSGAQSRLRRTTLANALQDPLKIAQSIGIVNVFGSGKGLIVGQDSFDRREPHEAPFQGVERDFLLSPKELRQAVSMCIRGPGFKKLCNTFMQPLRATPPGNLVDK